MLKVDPEIKDVMDVYNRQNSPVRHGEVGVFLQSKIVLCITEKMSQLRHLM